MTAPRGALAPGWARFMLGGAWSALAARAIDLALSGRGAAPDEAALIAWAALAVAGASLAADLDRPRPRWWLAGGGGALVGVAGLAILAGPGDMPVLVSIALALALIGALRAEAPRFHGSFVSVILPLVTGVTLLAFEQRPIGASVTGGLHDRAALADGVAALSPCRR